VDIELRLTADGPVVIEVNGRLGGYVAALLYRSFGVEAVRLAFEVAIGRQPVIPAREPTAVAFEYQVLPPVGDWRLASWGHIADLAERPEILSVVLHAAPGDRVDWRMGSQGTLGVISGTADRAEAVVTAVQAIEHTIAAQVVFSPA
jgi:biotin carboxylase